MRRTRVATLAILATLALARPGMAGPMTYLSIGDSVAFGETDFAHNPSNGDRGYVSDFANYLAGQNGGVRPNVVNLAIDGETSTSFFSGSGRNMSVPGETDQSAEAWNTRYTNPTISQDFRMLQAFNNQKNLGNSIGVVTISLGADDLFRLAESPSFQAATPAGQQAMLAQTLATITQNYSAILTQLQASLPDAKVYMLGQYNPFPGETGNPINGISQVLADPTLANALAGPALQGLNATLAALAKQMGATYVDTYTPFVGHESQYTYINSATEPGNVHPNALGYAVIAGQIEAVPEPSTLAVMGLCFTALVVTIRRRRAAGA